MLEQVIEKQLAQARLDIWLGVSWNGKLKLVCCILGSTAMKHLLQENKAAPERVILAIILIPQLSSHFSSKMNVHHY